MGDVIVLSLDPRTDNYPLLLALHQILTVLPYTSQFLYCTNVSEIE